MADTVVCRTCMGVGESRIPYGQELIIELCSTCHGVGQEYLRSTPRAPVNHDKAIAAAIAAVERMNNETLRKHK